MKINNMVFMVGSGKMGFHWTHPSDCNVYLIYNRGELALIDTGTGESVDEICANVLSHGFSLRQIKKILLTHVHADHAGGAALLKERTGAKVYVHYKAKDILKHGNEDKIDLSTAKRSGFYKLDYHFTPCTPDIVLRDGDTVSVGDLTLHVMETPGHSAFDLSFYIKMGEDNYLFSGDTIFSDGKISMIHTQDFDLHKLANSIKKLAILDVDYLLPGHYHFTIQNGSEHIKIARKIFENMGIPNNINN